MGLRGSRARSREEEGPQLAMQGLGRSRAGPRVPRRSRPGAVTDCLRGSQPALRDPAGKLRCMPNPTRHELLVELVVLVDVEVAHVLVLGLAGGRGRSDVPRKNATLTYFVKQ
jgi:hypothetical protein